MKQYDSYKDSGIEWMGKIPSHWEVKKIKYSFHIYAGATPKTEKKEYWDGDIEWITPADYKTIDKFVSKGQRTISEAGYNSCNTQLVPKESLIFSKRAPIGTVAISANPLCTNQGCLSCVPKDTNTLFNYYCASIATDYFDLLGSGATFKEISAASFANVKFPCPPFSEQKAIASFLDIQTERIDSIIASREKKIKLLEEIRASIISQAVTKGIRKDVEMKDSGIEWMGKIPKHWEFAPLKRYAKIETGSTPSTNVSKYWENPNIDWYTPGDFYGGLKLSSSSRKVEEIALNEEACPTFNPNTVLVVGIGASLGNVGIANKICSSNQQINAISFGNKIVPLFGAYYLSSIKEVMKSVSNSATLAIMNQSTTKGLVITCPPLKEQKEIVSFIEDKMSRLNSSISKAQREISLLREYRTSFITEVVTGKRKVTE